jgi:hypothetical protein
MEDIEQDEALQKVNTHIKEKLVGKQVVRRSLWRHKYSSESNIKINIRELICKYVNSVKLSEDRTQWYIFLVTVVIIPVQ